MECVDRLYPRSRQVLERQVKATPREAGGPTVCLACFEVIKLDQCCRAVFTAQP